MCCGDVAIKVICVIKKPSTVSILTVTVLLLTICFCWIETYANILTELLNFESGLLCFDRVSICRKTYLAF